MGMTQYKYHIGYTLGAFLVAGLLIWATPVHAETSIVGHLPAPTSTTNSLGDNHVYGWPYYQGQSFELDRTVRITHIEMQTSDLLGTNRELLIWSDSSGIMQVVATSSSSVREGNGAPQRDIWHFYFSPSYTASAGRYVITVNQTLDDWPITQFYGDRFNAVNDTCVTAAFLPYQSGVACDTTYGTGGSDAYFVVYVSDSAYLYSSTNNLLPSTGSTTQSTTVNFSFNYIALDDVTGYWIQLLNMTNGQSSSYTGQLTPSTQGSISRRMVLNSGSGYRWNVILTNTNGDQVAQTNEPDQYFSVVSNFGTTTILRTYTEFYTASSATLYYNSAGKLIFPTNASSSPVVSSGMKAWAVLGPVGEALCTRLGFSYLCDLQSVINELGSQNASQRDIVIEMPRTFNGTTTFTMLDVDNVIASSSGMIAHIRMIQAYGMWFLWGVSIAFFILKFL